MKTYKALTAVGAALIILGISSCTPDNNKSDNNSNKNENNVDFRIVEKQQTFSLEGSAKDYDTEKDLLYSCEARILMPQDIKGHSVDSLQNRIFKVAFDTTAAAGHNKLMEDAFRTAASELGYVPVDTVVPENTYDGYLIVEGDVASMTSTILSYSVTVSKYDPHAAHGMYGSYFINYDITGGRLFGLNDIITSDGLDKLVPVLRTTADAMRNFAGPTELKVLPADGNFYIDLRNNLVFVYQPYEIASYAQGLIEIPVPAYQISDILTPYGKSLFNL